jgi:hypothetical protein
LLLLSIPFLSTIPYFYTNPSLHSDTQQALAL